MVDVHKDKVKIFIKVPRMQQAQKLLKAMESDIKEEISSRHPEYYFSSPQRIRRHIWYEGQNEINWRCGSQSENHKRQCIQIEGATTTPILSIINNQIRKQVIILKKEKRSTKWAFLIYEESVPENYLEILESIHVPFVLSPWHNIDINSSTGEIKKSHKHGALFLNH